MEIDQELMSAVTGGLAAHDLSDDITRVAELDARLAETEAALKRARDRRAQIFDYFRPGSGGAFEGPRIDTAVNALDVADAMIKGESSATAAAFYVRDEDLARERDALSAAIPELARRIEDIGQQRSSINREARKRLKPVVAPLAEALKLEVEQAARSLLGSWAVLRAISDISDTNLDGLQGAETAIGKGLLENFGPLPLQEVRKISLPSELHSALQQLCERAGNLKWYPPSTTADPIAVR